MFNFKKSLDGSTMQLVKMPAAAGDYKVGMALTYTGGKLAAASGNAVVQYICADNAKLDAEGDIIVSPVTSDMIFNAKLTAFNAGTVVAGERLQISSDGMGVTATAGIGTNLFLCKVAMDIVAKHIPADEHGVRIAELDEMRFRQELWAHRPLTDFWRVGRGYARKLEQHGLFTMGDIARQSLQNEDLLYKLFGINAELLIDHAWGYEPCTIADIKSYRPESNSLSSGQVLHCPYTAEKAKLVLREMADLLALDLVDKGLVTDQIVLTIGYDIENLADPARRKAYNGPVATDHYGRKVPKHAHGTCNLSKHTASTKEILQETSDLFDRIVDKDLLIRRMNITANHVIRESDAPPLPDSQQMSLFIDYKQQAEDAESQEREKRRQKAVLTIKKKFGKNAILKGMNFEEGATAKDRNAQIGGHKA